MRILDHLSVTRDSTRAGQRDVDVQIDFKIPIRIIDGSYFFIFVPKESMVFSNSKNI
jgi:hypothetical protein